MIEKVLINYLENRLNIPCFAEEPKREIERYLIIEKTGSSEYNHINSATITVQSYAPSLSEACNLNKIMKETIKNITELDEISRVEINTDYNYTDTTKKKYRYQAVIDIVYF